MATRASSEPLKADGWGDVNEAADVTVRGEDHTSVVLRPNHPLILVRGTLHGCWPDQAVLTPEQALALADALRGMARRMGAREAAPAAKPAKARRRKAGAGEPGRVPAGGEEYPGYAESYARAAGEAAALDAAERAGEPDVIPTPPRDDDREAITEGDHHLYHPKAAAPDTTPNAIAGALADGASDDGLSLNAGAEPRTSVPIGMCDLGTCDVSDTNVEPDLVRCFVCRRQAPRGGPCERCKHAVHAGDVRVPGADGPLRVWVLLKEGLGWAKCELGGLGNWHVPDLPAREYTPDLSVIESAVAEQLSLSVRVREWSADEECHSLELVKVYKAKVSLPGNPAAAPAPNGPDDGGSGLPDDGVPDWLYDRPLRGEFPGDLATILESHKVRTFGGAASLLANGKLADLKGVPKVLGPIAGSLRQWWERNVPGDAPAWLKRAAGW